MAAEAVPFVRSAMPEDGVLRVLRVEFDDAAGGMTEILDVLDRAGYVADVVKD